MYRIGEFSIIAQVTGRLLRYYDEIGLLVPEYTEAQSGYRYYSARQLPRLNRILALKELGLSLENIARLLDRDASTDEIRGMLTLRKAQIEQSVHDELAQLRMVESRLQQIDAHNQVEELDVVVKSIPAQRFLSLREVLPDMDAVRRRIEKIYETVPRAVATSSLGSIAMVVHFPMYDTAALDFEIGYQLTGKAPKSVRLAEESVLTQHELPAIDMAATLAHVGHVRDIHQSYAALASWLEQNDWQMNGKSRHVFMQLPVQNKVGEDEAVVEVQLPICKTEKSRNLGA